MTKRGQGSVETVILLAAVLLIVTVIFVSANARLLSSQRAQARQIAAQSVQDLASAADEVYLAGEGATRKVWVSIPESVQLESSFIGSRPGTGAWANNKTIDLNLSRVGDVFAITRAPLCGKWPAQPGRYSLVLVYNSTSKAHVTINNSC
ncbi:MAG: class III signal peptide-containing protein [Candidatus Micrarchaeota archaeon]